MEDRIELYTSIIPDSRQLSVQEMKFYAFVHYSVNTFTKKEWGNGKENPKVFNPKTQNTDQWCEAIKNAEMKGVILTAKHHDGFCLWQTDTTEHSIKNSPYKNGKGDVVKELSNSCKKYGLKLGIYLSPWDRNCEFYGTDIYNDFYISQLTELLDGRYGEIFMLWLDGACASNKDGKPVQNYDFERIWTTALKLQPNICLSGCAPDIRWVGNESGKSRESEWNVVPKFNCQNQNINSNFQTDDNFKKFQKNCVDVMLKDMGSRNFLKNYNEFMWYPAEVDVSIRLGWFHHGWLDFTTKSLRKLMKIYYNSVGGNSLLLLNIPPNKQGLFSKKDVKRLKQMGELIRKEQALEIKKSEYPIYEIIEESFIYNINFEKTLIDRVRIEEDTLYSQRIEEFEIRSIINEKSCLLYKGTVIGFGKIAIFKEIETDNMQLAVKKCRLTPKLKHIEIIKSGA